jgi:hypothetical protein
MPAWERPSPPLGDPGSASQDRLLEILEVTFEPARLRSQRTAAPVSGTTVAEISWLWADHLPAAENALLPIARGTHRRAPGHSVGRLIDIVVHPYTLIGRAQPLGLGRLTREKKSGCNQQTRQNNLTHDQPPMVMAPLDLTPVWHESPIAMKAVA